MTRRHLGRCAANVSYLLLLLLLASAASAATYLKHDLSPDGLKITSDEATLTLRFHQPGAIEAFYEPPGVKQLPSFSIAGPPSPVAAELTESPTELVYRTPHSARASRNRRCASATTAATNCCSLKNRAATRSRPCADSASNLATAKS